MKTVRFQRNTVTEKKNNNNKLQLQIILTFKIFIFYFLKLEHSSIYSKRESWYKTFKASRGESSIQNTSSEIFLARCARA